MMKVKSWTFSNTSHLNTKAKHHFFGADSSVLLGRGASPVSGHTGMHNSPQVREITCAEDVFPGLGMDDQIWQ